MVHQKNGPSNSKEVDQLLERLCYAYANEKRNKIAQVYSLGKAEGSSSTLTKNNLEITVESCSKEISCFDFVQSHFFETSFVTSNFAEEGFSEEEYNVSDAEVA